MNSIGVWIAIGAATGLLSMMGLSLAPARYHRLGLWLAILAGAILAEVEFSQLPDWPGHSFERDPDNFFVPTMVGMAGVFGGIALVARRSKVLWLGALAGAALYPIIRVAAVLTML